MKDSMHVLIIADGRSPTTRRWIHAVRGIGYRISLVSTFPCADVDGVERTVVLPVAFSRFAGSQAGAGSAQPQAANRGMRRTIAAFRGFFQSLRYFIGPLTLPFYGARLARWVNELQPDLVHALRIPFEGMLASYTPQPVPVAVSTWGNDLTLHAAGSAAMGSLTRKALRRANGLGSDTYRDVRLARRWGLKPGVPTLVAPGSGGLDLTEINRIRYNRLDPLTDFLPAGVPIVVNPRGFRPGSVRNDVFFQAIPLVQERCPGVAFACPGMAGQPEVQRLLQPVTDKKNVYLLPHLPQTHLWDLFVRATVMVSISQHDGTPNSLLEAMACGCFPVAGDIESIREWITPGVNGLLVEPTRAQETATAILQALDNAEMRKRAAAENERIIRERAEVGAVREKIAGFYNGLMAATN